MGAVYRLTLRQLTGKWRILIMTLLAALPVIVATILLRSSGAPSVAEFETVVLNTMLAGSIAPLVVLAIAAAGFANETEDILDDPQVSRHHCQLKLQHGAYGFVDLQSRNGSLVNGQAVEEIALADGDRIRIGNTSIEFRLRG